MYHFFIKKGIRNSLILKDFSNHDFFDKNSLYKNFPFGLLHEPNGQASD
jgi:hypothetical protein